MTTVSQNKALVERFNRDVHEGQQIQAFHELVSPGFINHAAPQGKQGFTDTIHFFEHVLWPALSGIRMEILEQIGEGDRVVTRKILHAIQKQEFMGVPASNTAVEIKIIDIFRIAEGKLAEHWGMVDMHNWD